VTNADDRPGERKRTGKPQRTGLDPVLERNIRIMDLRRQYEARTASFGEKLADAITRFTGSLAFVYLHLVMFGFWIVANLRWLPGISPWDPSFVILAMIASVEAIFLSTFVLISQNRMAARAQRRNDLDLQINLLAEHEITKLVTLASAIAEKLDVRTEADSEMPELKKDVAPEAVLDHIEKIDPTK